MRIPALALAAVALVFGTLGCGLLQNPIDPTHGLEDSQKRFVRFLRWGKWKEAADYVAQEEREAFLESAKGLEEVRLTGYELLSLEIGDEARSATARVRYTGHPLSAPVERSVELTEHWSRPIDGDGWRVEVPIARLALGLRTAAR